ncbi:MAG: 23S rRNA (guanosine(2251)-2'-O)-methyltransferase RlmB [Clostridia bacterium]|nr:23S rRNA (guanosine(2251)-2'-O)-methyltransferase RlmB [Clostridia bacterium]
MEERFSENKIEGRNPVEEALRSGLSIDKIFISETANKNALSKIISLAKEKGVPYSFVSSKKVEDLSGTDRSQGVVAIASAVKYSSLDEILAESKKKGMPPFVVIADEITDPHNLGAIIRTANAAGADGVLIAKHRNVGVNAVVAKTSAGAVYHTKIAKVTSIPKAIDDLKKEGLWVFGADMDGKESIFKADLRGPCALVVGSEGKGIGKLVKEKCDFLVNIPMVGKTESLNASVAAGIVMYEILRRRTEK